MELPPYMKVISGAAVEPRRRVSNTRRAGRTIDGTFSPSSAVSSSSSQGEVVNLVSRQNQMAANSQIPTPMEAQAALNRLQRDLPSMGQAVGDIHANLDRRRILVLLAPLVES